MQGNTPRDGVLFLDGSRGSNGVDSNSPGRSGSIDSIPNFDPSALGFGNFGGLGVGSPFSASYPPAGPASLSDWLQLALAGNGAAPPFPQPRATPQQPLPAAPPLPFFFPNGSAPNTTPYPSAANADDLPSQLNPAGSGEATLGAAAPPTPQQAQALTPSQMQALLPEALRPLVRLFFPDGLDR